jgi:hypothetical protein
MQNLKAVLSLIKANTDKECVFLTCLEHLRSRPHVIQYLDCFLANHLLIDHRLCAVLTAHKTPRSKGTLIEIKY